MIQPTSLNAYLNEVLSTLGSRQREIVELFSKYPDLTNMEAAEILNWSINRVTPRVKELREKKVLISNKIRTCRVTGRKVWSWKINKPSNLPPTFDLKKLEERRIKEAQAKLF